MRIKKFFGDRANFFKKIKKNQLILLVLPEGYFCVPWTILKKIKGGRGVVLKIKLHPEEFEPIKIESL